MSSGSRRIFARVIWGSVVLVSIPLVLMLLWFIGFIFRFKLFIILIVLWFLLVIAAYWVDKEFIFQNEAEIEYGYIYGKKWIKVKKNLDSIADVEVDMPYINNHNFRHGLIDATQETLRYSAWVFSSLPSISLTGHIDEKWESNKIDIKNEFEAAIELLKIATSMETQKDVEFKGDIYKILKENKIYSNFKYIKMPSIFRILFLKWL